MAKWNEEKDGVRIERFITPNVSVEDLEEAIRQAGAAINLNEHFQQAQESCEKSLLFGKKVSRRI